MPGWKALDGLPHTSGILAQMPKSLNPVSPLGLSFDPLAELLYVKAAFQEGKNGSCRNLFMAGSGDCTASLLHHSIGQPAG